MKFGVIGEPISHSKSPQIFNYLFELHKINAYYTRILSPDDKLIHRLNLSGFNITSPYKSSFLATTHFDLKFETDIKSINAVLINENVARCFNFDYDALKKFIMLNLHDIENALIIGSGDTARTAALLIQNLQISADIYGRNKSKAIKLSQEMQLNYITLKELKPHYNLVISTIPNDSLQDIISQIKFEILVTSDYFNKIDNYVNHFTGIEWLIDQAKPFYHKITGKDARYIDIEGSLLIDKRKNIIHLTGFMGAGKSTVGKLLSKRINYDFIDLDTKIEKYENMSVGEIFVKKGESHFRNLEEKMMLEILPKINKVIISTGGGCITNDKIYKELKESAYNIYLSGDLNNLFERSKQYFRPLHFDDFPKFKKLFEIREDFYFSISDLIVNADIEANKLVDTIYEDINRTI